MEDLQTVGDVVPTAAVAILDAYGRILLGRRSDDATWCLPGGKLEFGESFSQCALRECREELGVEVELGRIVAVLSNPATQRHDYPDGRVVQFVGVVFRGTLGRRVGVGDGELVDTSWFGPDDLDPAEVMTADLPAILHALTGGGTPLID